MTIKGKLQPLTITASTAGFCIIEKRLLINGFYSALKLKRYLLIKLTLNYFCGLLAVVGMRTDRLHSKYKPTWDQKKVSLL